MSSPGKLATIYFDTTDLSPFFNSLDLSATVDKGDTTAFSPVLAKTYDPLNADAVLSGSGLFAYAPSGPSLDAILAGALGGSNDAASYGPAGDTIGLPAKLLQANETKYDVKSVVGDVVRTSLELQADGGALAGKWIFNQQAISASITGAQVDDGAASANGYVWLYHVFANTFSQTFGLRLQHSDDGITWVNAITATIIGGVVSSAWVVQPGTLKRFVRSLHSPTLSGTGALTLACAYARL